MRTTQSELSGVFRILLRELGKHQARSFEDVGGWDLEARNPGDGTTYIVTEKTRHEYHLGGEIRVGHGESHPLGDQRRTAGEMYDAMNFAIRVLEVTSGGPASTGVAARKA